MRSGLTRGTVAYRRTDAATERQRRAAGRVRRTARARRQALLVHVASRFASGREYPEDEVNRILQSVHSDHATLRRYLVDAGLLRRERGVYRRASWSSRTSSANARWCAA